MKRKIKRKSKPDINMENVNTLASPLLQSILLKIRDKNTKSAEFRSNLRFAGYLMTYEIFSREFSPKKASVDTVFCTASGHQVKENAVLVNIMRAAEPFIEGGIRLLDETNCRRQIGVVDAQRLETGEGLDFDIEISSFKVPEMKNDSILVIYDPMLATGSTLLKILEMLGDSGKPKKKIICSVISTPFGIKKIHRYFPDVIIYTLAVDTGAEEGLNSIGFIVPGLGDCGDRAFGT